MIPIWRRIIDCDCHFVRYARIGLLLPGHKTWHVGKIIVVRATFRVLSRQAVVVELVIVFDCLAGISTQVDIILKVICTIIGGLRYAIVSWLLIVA